MHIKTDTRVEGIRKTNVNTWTVVLSYPSVTEDSGPGDYTEARVLRAGQEFSGVGAKAQAIKAAGTNRVIA